VFDWLTYWFIVAICFELHFSGSFAHSSHPFVEERGESGGGGVCQYVTTRCILTHTTVPTL
jgi:hypothetical protein